MKILVVDDEPSIRFSLAELLEAEGFQVRQAEHAPAALAALDGDPADLVVSDLSMPAMDGLQLLEEVRARHPDTLFVLATAYGDERTAVRALKLGAYDYLPKPFDNEEVRALARRAREVLALRAENRRLREELAAEFRGLVGGSPAMRELFRLIRRAGPADVTVLVTGESGTGKELVARALHAESRRAKQAFVALNCSALPAELAESELFGHLRGAFTGADRDREGLFEAAHGGTLFLDEIGDLALPAQAKLLRALEQREVLRVGSTRPVPVDVRVVAATHQPLESLAAAGRFRADLLFRLQVVTLALPPLRERREDVPALSASFLAELAARHGSPARALAEGARRALLAYEWPGNVRELRNAIERAVVLAEGDTIEAADLPPSVAASQAPLRPADAALAELPYAEARARALEGFERSFLAAALERHGGNVSRTAAALGLHRQSLQKMLRRLGIALPPERAGAG
ncbi:MAG TPA: sigma-54 dependent transcriptional regulator [Longimicrobiaceae bacterium]|nr:sigma-54 dependent transcriptional regulator [Longimicrobiaceae bacterium]